YLMSQSNDTCTDICIWQQNTRKSKIAHEYVLIQVDPDKWDLILIQKPWIDKYSNARGIYKWRVIYPTNHFKDTANRIRPVILINTNISSDSYTAFNISSNDITALRLESPS